MMLLRCIISPLAVQSCKFSFIPVFNKCYFSTSKRSINTLQSEPNSKKHNDGIGKWLALIFPISGIMLGIWQVKRKKWKLGLIADLEEKTKSKPIPFPSNLNELEHLEYRPLIVTGAFNHSKELYIRPRHLIESNASKQADTGSLLSIKNHNIGMQVVTPFFIPDLRITILVNRGFVPDKKKDPKTRIDGQIEGLINLTGILRHNEKRPPLVPKNNPQRGQFNYKDINEMADLLGTSPVLIDAIDTVSNGPIGGQTKVTMRDEHIQYAITWFSLAAVTAVMWYVRFVK